MALLLSIALTACGTVTPSIQEFWGNPDNAGALESDVAQQIECELAGALSELHGNIQGKPLLESQYGFVFGWNAQVNLTFAADEQSTLNPTPSFITALHPLAKSQTFTLGLSGTYKNQATRTDKFTITYKVKDFIGGKKFDCKTGRPEPGTLFVRSDLKIKEWLYQALNITVSQGGQSEVSAHPKYPSKIDAISHDIRFDIVSSGGVAPTWKLVRFGTGGNPLLSGQRDRSQDLVLTMGPPDKANPDELGPAAQVSSLSSQLANSINAGRLPQ
ncbi:hypothetical protein [Mesorhizobium sp. B2-4-17]|uniref:hypothetical protein n=1 Tax=Mesorhizobium sp. B2-4-17 TaxID=2589932 RepID=UPI00112A5B7C|nr:hypothetical protein [Mesorhizobium sp. B2-4-17]TPK89443.1 hypothetical protein FJ548_10110 [Mesorhizobium sp. B2-4-17]